jgi:hypothetical protein
VLAPLDRGQIYCTRGSKRPTAYPERGGVVLIHPRDLCIQQYLANAILRDVWRVAGASAG